MLLGPVFEQFIRKSPLSVMSRATIEHALSASALDELFERSAQRGYTKELLFSTTVDLMSLVVCGKAIHLQSAFQQLRERVPVTLKCVYEKVQHIETAVSGQLVSHVADRCGALPRMTSAASSSTSRPTRPNRPSTKPSTLTPPMTASSSTSP